VAAMSANLRPLPKRRQQATAAAAAALTDAIAQARSVIDRVDARAAQSAARIGANRVRMLGLLGDAGARLAAGITATTVALTDLERRRRAVAALAERRARTLERAIVARRIALVWRLTARTLAFALVAGVCLWWGFKVWGGIAVFVARLFPDAAAGPP